MSISNSENHVEQIKQLELHLGTARSEINNLRQQLKALQHVHRKECDDIKRQLVNFQCQNCHQRTDSPEGATAFEPDCKVIGVIHTNFPEKRGTPRQPAITDAVAKLTINNVFTNPEHSIQGLEEFSHMWVLFYFHRNDASHVRAKVAPPRLNGVRTGVFATRSPHRPSPIGLSLVKIEKILANHIFFSGVDMVDQTPVLDIKPYIPQYDNPALLRNIPQEPPEPSVPARTMDGEEQEGAMGAAGLEESYLRLAVREAPDGEEEESASVPAPIRVPSWIDDPPVGSLTVLFKDRALDQLAALGVEGADRKRVIMNVLREDPRSVYLRQRWGSHSYIFRISELYVSCQFNDAERIVTVNEVRQQNSSGEGEETQQI